MSHLVNCASTHIVRRPYREGDSQKCMAGLQASLAPKHRKVEDCERTDLRNHRYTYLLHPKPEGDEYDRSQLNKDSRTYEAG